MISNTGYTRAETMQKQASCAFLHGPLTAPFAIQFIQEAIHGTDEEQIQITYYRKNGGCKRGVVGDVLGWSFDAGINGEEKRVCGMCEGRRQKSVQRMCGKILFRECLMV